MFDYIWLIPLFPLLGFLVNGLFGKNFTEKQIGAIGSWAIGLSFVVTAGFFYHFTYLPESERFITRTFYTWISAGSFEVNISFLLDPLSLVMVLIITGVGTLIHIYSIGYMHGDTGYARYFAFLNLFTFSMLLLILADNFLLLFVGWEGVGLCSYLLIGFWFENNTYAYAGRKAFVINRVGDFGFLLGVFLIFNHFGTLNFHTVFSQAPAILTADLATAICLLLFVGAVGKSAQIPLFIWLPEATAGPTPVSALINAATMIFAGVYLVARCHVLFLHSQLAMSAVTFIGISTAFLAATIALVSTDIKKVLAYSAISQLGYMYLACGVGAFSAGIFHLNTHAYFIALLFMSAGSIVHALKNETDIRKMGNLREKMPVTYRAFFIGALVLAGLPLLSGFFSKNEILWNALISPYGGFKLWLVGAAVAGLTAFYTFRLIFLIFYGESRVAKELEPDIQESPPVMTVPLGILAFLAIVGGWLGIPHFINKFEHFLQPVFNQYVILTFFDQANELANMEVTFIAASSLIAVLGIGFAYLVYVRNPSVPDRLVARVQDLHTFLENKWYVDKLYDMAIIRPVQKLADVVLWRWFDIKLIDGLVNLIGDAITKFSGQIRKIATGYIQNYAMSIVFGIIILAGYFLLTGVN